MPSPNPVAGPISSPGDRFEDLRRSKGFRIAAVAICGMGLAGAAVTLVRVAQDALDGRIDGRRQVRAAAAPQPPAAMSPPALPPAVPTEQPPAQRTEIAAGPLVAAPDSNTMPPPEPDPAPAASPPEPEPAPQRLVTPAPVESPVVPVPIDPPVKAAEAVTASPDLVPAVQAEVSGSPPADAQEPPPAAAPQRLPARAYRAIRATPIPARALTVPAPPAAAPAPPKARVPSRPTRFADAPERRPSARPSPGPLQREARPAPSQFRLVPTPPGFGPTVRAYSFVADSGRVDGSGARVTVVRVR